MANKVGRPVEMKGVWGDLSRAMGSVKALAEALDVSVDAVARWSREERDPKGPTIASALRLCSKYKVSAPARWRIKTQQIF